MSEIPEDIMKAAEICADDLYFRDSLERGEGEQHIAKAILAERERCWFIVKEKSEGDLDFAAFLIMKGDK